LKLTEVQVVFPLAGDADAAVLNRMPGTTTVMPAVFDVPLPLPAVEATQ
jgi:hypothetical protein